MTLIVEVADAPTVAGSGEVAAMVKLRKLNVALAVRVITGDVIVPVIESMKLPAEVELHETVAV